MSTHIRSSISVSQFDVQYLNTINPFIPNGMSRNDQLEKSISNLRVVGNKFTILFQFLKDFFWKQTVKNLIGRIVLRRLIWFCPVCRCPTKRTPGLYGLTQLSFSIQHI